jgi:hypothetical protein
MSEQRLLARSAVRDPPVRAEAMIQLAIEFLDRRSTRAAASSMASGILSSR